MISRLNSCGIKCLSTKFSKNYIRKIIFLRNFSDKVQIARAYNPRDVERNHSRKWEEGTKFPLRENKPIFSIILPPPNVTGNLHLGHALMCTIGDVLCRRKQQQGFDVVWVPGTDHAGIATQVVVEKSLLKQRNLSRYQIGREAFLCEIWKWKHEKEANIRENLKRMGCTLSWDHEYFTMDKHQETAVQEAFFRLFKDGLIKRKESLVNWSCTLESAISDIEVNNLEINGPTSIHVPGYDSSVTFGQLFDIAYKICDRNNEEIIVSTTRPETLLGDVAIAVHPDDERYVKYRGVDPIQVWHPFRNEPIPIIFDDSVEKDFGTGAVKITPAHDKTDYELAARHNLTNIPVFTNDGRIRNEFDGFSNLPRFDARERIIEALNVLNLLRNIKPHVMDLPICSRSKDIVEYMLRPQWFLQCKEMADAAMDSVKSGKIKIIPKNYETDWFRWLSNCKDWCISRQLWWGHQIPAYYCEYDGNSTWITAASDSEARVKAKQHFQTDSDEVVVNRDPDVLDTWFSSSLLPFSAFKWPKENYEKFYPLDVMVTGHDILFFWVARMVMMGQKLTGQIPFRNILLNGIVCDAHGRKMSKSLGNVIHPQQVIDGASLENLKQEIDESYNSGTLSLEEKNKSKIGVEKMFPNGIPECGIDALRFTLCSHNIKPHFINFDISECFTNKLFFNKIWQATRYTLSAYEKLNLDIREILPTVNISECSNMDRWILSRLGNTKKICNQSFESYNFHTVVSAMKTFFYTNFCDVYLETTKPAISAGNDKGKMHCFVLAICLREGLEIMAPYTPFLADELLKYIPQNSDIPYCDLINEHLEKETEKILSVSLAIRQMKSKNQIKKEHQPIVHIFPESNSALKLLCDYKDVIKVLTFSHDIVFENNCKKREQLSFTSTASHLCAFGISTNCNFTGKPVETVINKKKLEKLQKNLEKLLKQISAEAYKTQVKADVQKKHFERIKRLKNEINNIKKVKEDT